MEKFVLKYDVRESLRGIIKDDVLASVESKMWWCKDGIFTEDAIEPSIRFDIIGKLSKTFKKDGKVVYVCVQENEDRVVFIIVDAEDIIVGINYHMGLSDIDETFGDACPHLTEIYERIRHNADSDEDAVNKAIELHNIAFIDHEVFLNGTYINGHKSESSIKNAYSDTIKFFTKLIEETDTYFLSDYVEDTIGEYVPKKKADLFISQLKTLESKCRRAGLNIHEISQEVASIYLLGQ